MKVDFLSTIFPRPRFFTVPALGLDISDEALKYVLLKKNGNKIRLDKYGEVPVPSNVLVGGVIRKRDELVEKIKEIRHMAGDKDYVYSALPEEKGYVVSVQLPVQGGSSLRDTAELHLEENVPLEPSNATFDFDTLISKSKDGTPIVLTAVDTAFVSSYEEVLRDGGFLPVALELESSAIARALIPLDSNKTFIILDIGRGQSSLSIVSSGKVRMSSGLSIGGDAITKAIVEDLSVSDQEANKLKEELGLVRSELAKAPLFSIVRVATILRDEIYQRISYWDKENIPGVAKSKVERLILCGGNANIPGLAEYLTSGVNIPVSVGNPWTNITNFEDYIPELPANEALRFCTAVGLALRAYVND